MTFGKKLKNARKEANFSQEQLAEKLSVSRSAIAKWETDKGMPDVQNLKVIAQLLDVSVDYLLDEDEKISFNEIKESINLDDYEKTGKCRGKKDAVVVAKYADADSIIPLIRSKKLNNIEWVIDFVIQPGILQLTDYANDVSAYYLVEKCNKQYLINVTNEFITSSELSNTISSKKFIIGNNRFKEAGYQLI
ncbi:helix-turn-helix domain-containing protein [Lacrimispora algidixylanolytica]|uniref:HTH cro/C1-type domain-containing protein n=1 Tax=Lacrimispora algidixylanolytica TaxID=94868 RepID=A0A419T1L5_9FIRM|nr:helix-turn-helix transcriptional regulator [Lacrimispora algidixylanolytica]RKD31318.1 hypothetical protein BET01_20960 [Lacrimispora algidixylanolytica]